MTQLLKNLQLSRTRHGPFRGVVLRQTYSFVFANRNGVQEDKTILAGFCRRTEGVRRETKMVEVRTVFCDGRRPHTIADGRFCPALCSVLGEYGPMGTLTLYMSLRSGCT
jgi:hypothetical protein